MIGLTGPRGIGKTTLVLQHIKKHLNPDETLYVNAEDFYFADNRLMDLADYFVKGVVSICVLMKFISMRNGLKS